jgi:hypothetical protein
MTVPYTFANATSPIPLSQLDSNFSAIGNTTNISYTAPFTGSVTETVQSKLSEIVSLKDFGAVGDGVTDDTTAVNAWYAQVLISGAGYVPKGTYKTTSTIIFDVLQRRTTGVTISGDGPRNSIFSSTVTSGDAFQIICSGGTPGSPKSYFYSSFSQIGFQAATSGSTLTIGQSDLSDGGNSNLFTNITVNNSFATGTPSGLTLNNLYTCSFNSVTVNGSGNVANVTQVVVLNQVQFSNFIACSFSNGATSIILNSGYIFGNVISNLDSEFVNLNVQITSTNATKNLFIGGQYTSLGTYNINAAAGSNNLFSNANLTGSSVTTVNNSVGLTVQIGTSFNAYGNTFYILHNDLTLQQWGSENYPVQTFTYALGTQTSPTVLTSATNVGAILGSAYDGTTYRQVSRLEFQSLGAPVTSTSSPGSIKSYTTATSSVTPTARTILDNSGNFYPVTDNAYNLGNSGNRWTAVWAANGTIQTSDQRAKIDITPSALGLNFINSLNPVSYKWIEGSKKVIRQIYLDEDGKEIPDGQPIPENATPGEIITESVPGERTHWGLIAQEVKTAVDAVGVDFGGWVLTDKNDAESQQALRYDQFIGPLIKAVQELSAEVKSQADQIVILKNKVGV